MNILKQKSKTKKSQLKSKFVEYLFIRVKFVKVFSTTCVASFNDFIYQFVICTLNVLSNEHNNSCLKQILPLIYIIP